MQNVLAPEYHTVFELAGGQLNNFPSGCWSGVTKAEHATAVAVFIADWSQLSVNSSVTTFWAHSFRRGQQQYSSWLPTAFYNVLCFPETELWRPSNCCFSTCFTVHCVSEGFIINTRSPQRGTL